MTPQPRIRSNRKMLVPAHLCWHFWLQLPDGVEKSIRQTFRQKVPLYTHSTFTQPKSITRSTAFQRPPWLELA